MTDRQGKLLHIIQAHGRENPISWQEVRGQLSLLGETLCDRGIRREVEVLKAEGYMILCTTGYWIATTEEDIDEMNRVARKLYEHADSERDAADQIEHWSHKLRGVKRRELRLAEQGSLFV